MKKILLLENIEPLDDLDRRVNLFSETRFAKNSIPAFKSDLKTVLATSQKNHSFCTAIYASNPVTESWNWRVVKKVRVQILPAL